MSLSGPSLTQTFGRTQSKAVPFPIWVGPPLALVPFQPVISYLSPSLTPPLRSLGPCLTCGWKYRAGAGLSNLGRVGGPPVLVHPKVAAAFKGSAANASKVHSLAPPLPPPASRPKVGRAVVDLHLRHQEQEVGGGRDAGEGRRRVSPPLRLLVMQLWGRARCAVAAAVTQRWMEWRPRVELENDPQCNVCQSS